MKRSDLSRPAGQDALSDASRAFLAVLESLPEATEEEDPNGWFWQIWDHLERSPRERMERWVWFVEGDRRLGIDRGEIPRVRFDPVRVLRSLSDHQVVFVAVGMGAAYLQGAPYPSYNLDITPRLDAGNLARLQGVLEGLQAESLERDEWGPVAEDTLPGFRRLLTSAGMVNLVDALPGVGSFERVMEFADVLEVADGLSVPVASLEDVICSKETVGELIIEAAPPYSRMMDGVHVLMCKETLALKKNMGYYAAKWNLSTA